MRQRIDTAQYISLSQTLLDCCHNKEAFHNTLLQNLPEDVDKRREVLMHLYITIQISKSELLHAGMKKGDLLSAVLKCKNVIANIFKLAAAKLRVRVRTDDDKLIESIRKYYKNTSSAFQKYATTGARIVLFVPQAVFLVYLSIITLLLGTLSTDSAGTWTKSYARKHNSTLATIFMTVIGTSIVSIIQFIRNIFNLHNLHASQTKQTQKRLSTLLRTHLQTMPDVEATHMKAIFMQAGLSEATADAVNRDVAALPIERQVSFHDRFELGIEAAGAGGAAGGRRCAPAASIRNAGTMWANTQQKGPITICPR